MLLKLVPSGSTDSKSKKKQWVAQNHIKNQRSLLQEKLPEIKFFITSVVISFCFLFAWCFDKMFKLGFFSHKEKEKYSNSIFRM